MKTFGVYFIQTVLHKSACNMTYKHVEFLEVMMMWFLLDINILRLFFKDRHGSSNDVFRKKYQKRVFAIF